MALDLDALLVAETSAFLIAISQTAPDDPVPTCPDWTADDLLWHLAEVQHFWSAIVGERMTDASQYSQPVRPIDRPGLLVFFAEAHSGLVAALSSASDDEAAWSWFAEDQTVGFCRRRQVHEALIHRVDAELTAGLNSTINSELAADGVLEMLQVMLGGAPPWGEVNETGPIGEIDCDDVDGRWLVQVQSFSGTSPASGTAYIHEPVVALIVKGEPTFTISGSAADLDRWFWNRPPDGSIVRTGHTEALDQLISAGMQ